MTDSEVARWRGRVVRAWREASGLQQNQVADHLHVSPQAVNQWERGQRTMGRVDLEHLQEAFEIPPLQAKALFDMWISAGTVTDGLPRTTWAHNFPPPSRPVWLWARPESPGKLSGRAWWGEPFQGRVDLQVESGGVFVTAPTSIPNPALHVILDQPGWVDFGVGEIPQRVADELGALLLIGTAMMDGVTLAVDPPLDAATHRALAGLFGLLRRSTRSLGIGWHTLRPHLGMSRSDRAPHALDANTLTVPRGPDPSLFNDSDDSQTFFVSPEHLRRIREARGLSRAEASRDISELDPSRPVTPTMIERLETTGRLPKVTGVVSRVDRAYSGDGRLGIERTFSSSGHASVTKRGRDYYRIEFPWYWIGPVWIRADTDMAVSSGVLDLEWGHWRRPQRIQPGNVVTTRQSTLDTPPLLARVPTGWSISAGMGAVPTALDINRGWWPKNVFAAGALLIENLNAIGEKVAFRSPTMSAKRPDR